MTSPIEPPSGGETLDTFYHGRVRILQKEQGYRFSVDAPLLADFIRTKEDDEALDLGAGSGVISLLLSLKPLRRITALEVQPGLADLARRNVDLNGLRGRVEVVEADLRTYDPERTFDLVFSNPPYIRRSTGFLSRSAEKSAAKHELHGGIDDFLRRTAEWLAPAGRACFVYPEKRRKELLLAAGEFGLTDRRLRFVHPRQGEPPNLFLIELGRASEPVPAGPELMPPLVLYGPGGAYTAEAEAVFSGP